MVSILAKLYRFRSMQLSQMQDLGGCRAVVGSVEDLDALVRVYESRVCPTAELCEKYDFMNYPKADGYRGVHFVYRYNGGGHEHRSRYDGLRIEIQLRSAYQHAWATAVETIDAFTKQALKSGIGRPEWKRFFLLVSCFIALMEHRTLAPGVTKQPIEWFAELEELIRQLRVIPTLTGLNAGMQAIEEVKTAGRPAAYILVLDSDKQQTCVIACSHDTVAAAEYAKLERENFGNSAIQTVMVSVDSVEALREGFPSYYLDTTRFVAILRGFTGRPKRTVA